MTTAAEATPPPCLRCTSASPLTSVPRDELYFYTARLNLSGSGLKTDVDRQPRGRLCEDCTRSFVTWLEEVRS